MDWSRLGCALLLTAAFMLPAAISQAHVSSVDVASRTPYLDGRTFGAAGAYERIVGTMHFADDPNERHNREVIDLDKAPRDAAGLVESYGDLVILTPSDPARRNGTVLFEVSNRGGRALPAWFDLASGGADNPGDGFLLDAGYTLVWVGWQFDVPQQANLLRLHAPVVTENGKPVTGLVRDDNVPSERGIYMDLAHRDHVPYPVADPNDPANVLTVRDGVDAPRTVIPRTAWQFAPGRPAIRYDAGFIPGKIYELVYRAKDPVPVGLGLAAVRDAISYFKYDRDAVVPVKRAYGFGISQSGRFLRHFLYQGFNQDERGRDVFDGVLAHVAGAGRGSFNHRFAQPSRDGPSYSSFFYPTDLFPFTPQDESDPIAGDRDGLLSHEHVDSNVKIFLTNTSYEYWGRGVSLTHTTPDGRADVALPSNVREYLLTGGQHFSLPIESGPLPFLQNQPDVLDYRYMMRALLVDLDAWVRRGTLPPASRIPSIASHTLVAHDRVAFPKIPGVRFPAYYRAVYRVDYGPRWKTDGIIDNEPPKAGVPFGVLLPQVDADGNDIAGIRLPEISVPLATYTGWNLRTAVIGAPDKTQDFYGSFIPFAATHAERSAAGDPRLSIAERYSSEQAYLAQYRAAAERLANERLILRSDIPALMERARLLWQRVQAQ
ncbi:MAG: alpha/beta hydrolase domain-containing protein [Vulcanimicrobiaceae bacterium]